jgi:tetratricopeptide (TPR) repeat protein
MNASRKSTWIAALLLAALFAGSVITRRHVERLRGSQSTLEEVLYLPSGKTVKRFSLGYSSLLADIYWTRAVQYFGAKHIQSSTRYDLLAPLLEITTDLDPHLIVAYETGSILLSQKLPDGAGQPDKAVALVEKGIRENPDYWRLYFTLGFIHYVDRHDYKAAQQAFEKGSEVPGALPWMKVMAARMAEKGNDAGTAMYLWKTIYENTHDANIRQSASQHLLSLRADMEMDELERRTRIYYERFGAFPEQWSDLVHAGLLRGIPQDPKGNPYKLRLDGTVRVENPKQFPFLEKHAPIGTLY